MNDMMAATGTASMMDGFGSGFLFLWGLHVLSVIVFGIGLLFLILWAVKTLSQGQFKTWGIGLVVAGTIVCLLTIGVMGHPWTGGGMMGGSHMKMRMQMMEKMMDERSGGMMDDEDEDEDGNGGHRMGMGEDMMSMSMDDMAAMLEGKTGDAFDEAFLEGMIPHHQGAIDMARAAQTSAKHEEIKRMAEDIISAQQREIDQMRQWMRDWGYTQ